MPASTKRPHTPLALIILDGWGLRAEREYNAVALANPTNFYDLLKRYRNSTLQASGEAVGLPEGQMGNSEVGHTNLGAGRVVYQDLTRIDKSIRDGDFFERPKLLEAIDRCKGGAHALHLIGLLSDGGVHSHQSHLHAIVELAKRRGVTRVFVHVLTDGRDTAPNGGKGYVAALEAALRDDRRRQASPRCRAAITRWIATSGGSASSWRMTRSCAASVRPRRPAGSVIDARSYARDNVTDEFIIPTVITDAAGKPVGPVADGDSVVFFNFRADRMRQIIRAIAFDDFDGFERRATVRASRSRR